MTLARLGARIAVAVATIAGALVAAPAQAAAPPGVTHLAATTYDHTIALSWYNPAAAYAPGASLVVRLTRGRTPAATPSAGYAVAVTGGRYATARTLTADVPYTFAVWVRDGTGRYSPRRTLTASTRRDVTAPGAVSATAALGHLVGRTPTVTVSWTNPGAADLDGVRVVRNTAATPTGGAVLATSAKGTSFVDNRMPTQDSSQRYWYYLAARDTTGHFSPYVLVPVLTPQDDTVSAMAGTVRGTGGRLLSDIAVQQGDDPPMEEGSDPPIYNVTDSHGTWVARTTAGASTSWKFFAGYDENGPDPGGLPVSHRPTGYLQAHRNYAVQGAGEFRTVPDVTVPAAAAVAGTVTTPGGTPLAGVRVSAYVSGQVTALTDATGHYLVYGVTPGSTPVVVDGTSVTSSAAPFGYSVLWTGDADTVGNATAVTTTAGNATRVDFVLPPRGRASGTVNPADHVTVEVFDADVDFDVATLTGDSWAKALRPGDYTICAVRTVAGEHGEQVQTAGCWDGTTTIPWDGRSDHLPQAAIGAAHVLAAGTTSGIALDVSSPPGGRAQVLRGRPAPAGRSPRLVTGRQTQPNAG